MFLLQVFDLTRQSIEVIEDTRFQNNYDLSNLDFF